MDDLQEGISSPDVLKVQKAINDFYQASIVPESGDFDRATTAGVMRFQKDVKQRQTGVVDAATLRLLQHPPRVKVHKLVIQGNAFLLTEEQYRDVSQRLAAAAEPTVEGYESRAREVRGLWDAHHDVIKSTFFLIPAVLDVWAGTSLPPESMIQAAEKAAARMRAALRAADADAIAGSLTDGDKPITAAITAMSEYRDKLYAGGASLIRKLEMVRDGAADVVAVCALVVSAGATTEVSAGVLAASGGYGSLLTQIDKASHPNSFSATKAFETVLTDSAIGAITGALLGNDGLMKEMASDLGEVLGEKALKEFGSDVVKKIAEKAVQNGLTSAITAAIADVIGDFKPGAKMTKEQIAKDVVEKLVAGAAFGATYGALNSQLEKFAAKCVQFFKPEFFKGLGKVDLNKLFAKGGQTFVQVALQRIGKPILLKFADDPRKLADIGIILAIAIAADPKVNAAMIDLAKKQNLL